MLLVCSTLAASDGLLAGHSEFVGLLSGSPSLAMQPHKAPPSAAEPAATPLNGDGGGVLPLL
jgi:hypothetical protein